MVNKNSKNLELQLIIIAILIPAYLQMIPTVIQPTLVFEEKFNFQLLKIISYALGGLWFITLTLGTFLLIDKKNDYFGLVNKVYKRSFEIDVYITLLLIIFILSVYASYLVLAKFF